MTYREIPLEKRVEILEQRIKELEESLREKVSNASPEQDSLPHPLFDFRQDEEAHYVFPWSHGIYKCPFCNGRPNGGLWGANPNVGIQVGVTHQLTAFMASRGFYFLHKRKCKLCESAWYVAK